jgi:hypothetical protein
MLFKTRCFIVFTVLALSTVVFAETPTHLWSQRFGDDLRQSVSGVAVDSWGSVVAAGALVGTVDFGGGPLVSEYPTDVFVVKFDPDGNHFWSHRFGGVYSQYASSVAVDGWDQIVVAGNFQNTIDFGGGPLVSAGDLDIFVVKFSYYGDHIWSKRFGDADMQSVRGINVDASGNVLVTGDYRGTLDFGGGPLVSAGDTDIFVVKFDRDGNHLWSKRFGDQYLQVGQSVAADGSRNVVVAGDLTGTVDFGGGPVVCVAPRSSFVAKFDQNGNHLWSKRFGETCYQWLQDIDVSWLGDVVVTGTFCGTVDYGGGMLESDGNYDIFAAKFDPDGNHVWSRQFGDTGDDQGGRDIAFVGSGDVTMGGEFYGAVDFGGGPLVSAGDTDIFLAKLDPDGNHLWSRRFGDESLQWLLKFAIDWEHITATGVFAGSVDFGGGPLVSAGDRDMYVVKFEMVDEPPEPVASDVRIFHDQFDQCHPRPNAHLDTLVLAEWDFELPYTGNCDPQGWIAVDNSGRGDFAGLHNGWFGVLQLEDCPDPNSGNSDPYNPTCLWGFFSGSTDNYGCGGYPSQSVVPYGLDAMYVDNEIWSPPIPLSGAGSSVLLEFDVLRDLPLDNLVFYKWRVRSIKNGVPGEWREKNWSFYGAGRTKDWIGHTEEIGDLLDPSATEIQVALGVVDMCEQWCGRLGTGSCHSNAPLIDNVRLSRVGVEGPTWDVRQIDLFQDNFADDGTLTGTVRADMAKDILPLSNPNIRPGDSSCVWVGDLDNGLAGDPFTGRGPAAYCHVALWPDQPDKVGLNLEAPETRADWGVGKRFPFVNSYTDAAGVSWYVYRMDTVLVGTGFFAERVKDRYCIDFNDEVLTPGDTVCFFFSAVNTIGLTTYWTEFAGTTTDQDEVTTCPMEFTCLPAGGYLRGGDILYVDAFDGRGAQEYFDQAFRFLGIDDLVDRFDQRGPSSLVNNGLGSRVAAASTQLIGCYRKVIWNSGDLPVGTIGDGLMSPLKTDDFGLLYTFLDQHPNGPGIYFSGDNLGEEWVALAGVSAVLMRTTYMGYNLASPDHVAFGEPASPMLHGLPGSMFVHDGTPDTLVAFGGCPKVNNFDLFYPTGTAVAEMGNPGSGANYVISQTTTNAVADTARVVLSGFSFHEATWLHTGSTPVRAHHLRDILQFLQNSVDNPVAVNNSAPLTNYLANNCPNPFNPVTTIRYGIDGPTHVSLKIYNVEGRLVKTLLDEFQTPVAAGNSVTWRGVNDAGKEVGSGVYFYKLVTKRFTQTKKMVLLK